MRADLERAIRRAHRGARVEARTRTRLGDLPALATELSVAGPDGRRQEILVMSAESRWRVYGVSVFSARENPASTMTDLAAVIDSFEFRAPA